MKNIVKITLDGIEKTEDLEIIHKPDGNGCDSCCAEILKNGMTTTYIKEDQPPQEWEEEFEEKFMQEYYMYVSLSVGYPRTKKQFHNDLKSFIRSLLQKERERCAVDEGAKWGDVIQEICDEKYPDIIQRMLEKNYIS